MSDVFQTAPTGDETALGQLVGEGKKFATVEDLAKGKLEADSHVTQLETEAKLTREQMAALETDKGKSDTVADLIKAVKEANEQAKPEDNQASDEDLSKRIRELLNVDRVTETKESNRAKANQAVLDKVKGDVEAAKSYVAEKAKEHSMTVAELQSLGETSPTAFHTLMETSPSTGTPSVSALPGVVPQSDTATVVDGHRTKAYYDALKKELGSNKYWSSSKIQGEYTKDAIALGDRFNS